MQHIIENEFEESISVKQQLLSNVKHSLIKMAKAIVASYTKGGKLLVFGNGGSAADAQHLAGEIVGRFKMNRAALPCIALTTDTSILTAIANDFGFETIFARQIEGLANENDVILAISTSGNSPNVLQGVEMAKRKKCLTFALSGKGGGKMVSLVDEAIIVPSDNSQRIQESHILILHTLCSLIETLYQQMSDCE